MDGQNFKSTGSPIRFLEPHSIWSRSGKGLSRLSVAPTSSMPRQGMLLVKKESIGGVPSPGPYAIRHVARCHWYVCVVAEFGWLGAAQVEFGTVKGPGRWMSLSRWDV